MRNLICERCGYEYTPDEGYRVLILKRQTEKGADYVEMCRYCYASLLFWNMNGREDHDRHDEAVEELLNNIMKHYDEPNDFGEEQ